MNAREKISKGYRLKRSTHEMVKKMQTELDSTQDKVIRSALNVYCEYIRNSKKNVKAAGK